MSLSQYAVIKGIEGERPELEAELEVEAQIIP
jgi:hypothetical protein